MNSPRSVRTPQALSEAAEWLSRLNAPQASERDRREFAQWLKRSPQHVQHFLELTDLDAQLQDAKLFEGLTLEEGAAAEEGNVVALHGAPDKPAAARGGWPLAVAAVLAVAVAGLAWYANLIRPQHYESAVGELRSIVMDDGSIVTLNTQSEIQVRYTDDARTVRLLRGEAFFRVAKRQSQPFSVEIDGARVRALGTAFNVYRRSGGDWVTVTEGRVALLTPESQSPAKILTAGEQAAVRADPRVERLDTAALARVTGWTQRQLIFDNAPVSEVVAELNRYNRTRLVVEDADLAARAVTGTFESADPESFVAFLAKQTSTVVRRDKDGAVRLGGGKSPP